jgi:hypothetical protein
MIKNTRKNGKQKTSKVGTLMVKGAPGLNWDSWSSGLCVSVMPFPWMESMLIGTERREIPPYLEYDEWLVSDCSGTFILQLDTQHSTVWSNLQDNLSVFGNLFIGNGRCGNLVTQESLRQFPIERLWEVWFFVCKEPVVFVSKFSARLWLLVQICQLNSLWIARNEQLLLKHNIFVLKVRKKVSGT